MVRDYDKTFATSKALAVAQFCNEQTFAYNGGFALTPQNAILNFTINGLTPTAEVDVSFSLNTLNINGTVTTDGSGTATFAIGVETGVNINLYSLTVGGKDITITSSDKVLEKGKIYNITRNAAPALNAATISDIGKLAGKDGKIYANIASAHTKITGGTWRLPTIKDWQYMFIGCGASGSYSDNPSSMSSGELESKLRTAGGTAFAIENSTYWSGTEYDNLNSWRLYFESGNKSGTASFSPCPFNSWCRVRACLAF